MFLEMEKVPAAYPFFGQYIVDNYDTFPRGFTQEELNKAYANLAASEHDYNMLMEAATMQEVDEYFNPGTEKVDPAFIFEAIVIDKFSRTERRMNTIVRVFNKHLAHSEINALPAIVNEPKKSGSFAYVTAQLPFSDGQVVSVIFHASEGDKKKIASSDTIIAFRWILNKRDITHLVAPEQDKEVSLEAIGKRVTQLVVKNSARFEKTQKEAAAEENVLEEAIKNVNNAKVKEQELIDAIAALTKNALTVDAKIANAHAKLKKQKAYNAELQAKIDSLNKSRAARESFTQRNGCASIKLNQTHVGRIARQFTYAELAEKGARLRSKVVAQVPANAIKKSAWQTAIEAAQEWVEKNVAGSVQTEIGEVIIDAKAVKNSFSHSIYQNKLDALQAIVPVLQHGEYLGTLPDKDGKKIDNYYFAGKVQIGDNEKIVFVRTRKADGADNRFYVHEVFTQEEIEKPGSVSNRVTSGPDRPFRNAPDFYIRVIANVLNVKSSDLSDSTEIASKVPPQ